MIQQSNHQLAKTGPTSINYQSISLDIALLKEEILQQGYTVIRGQHLSIEQFKELGSRLGKIHEEESVKIKPNEEVLIYSDRAIPLHNDGSEGRYIGLYCIEAGDPPVGTWLVDVRDLLDKLDSETVEYLKNIRFRRGWGEHEQWFNVLTTTEKSFTLYFAPWKLDPPRTFEEQDLRKRFLCYVKECFKERGVCITLTPGEALFFDNHHFLHGRDQLPVDSKRWLHRFWIEESK